MLEIRKVWFPLSFTRTVATLFAGITLLLDGKNYLEGPGKRSLKLSLRGRSRELEFFTLNLNQRKYQTIKKVRRIDVLGISVETTRSLPRNFEVWILNFFPKLYSLAQLAYEKHYLAMKQHWSTLKPKYFSSQHLWNNLGHFVGFQRQISRITKNNLYSIFAQGVLASADTTMN